jgi:hypothetical protein
VYAANDAYAAMRVYQVLARLQGGFREASGLSA